MTKVLASKYLNLLGEKRSVDDQSLQQKTFIEKAIVHTPFEISEHLSKELIEKTSNRLHLEYEKTLLKDDDHRTLIKEILQQGKESLAIIGTDSPETELSDKQAFALEAVVIANGTRPSIKLDDLKTNKFIDFGEWKVSFSDFKKQILDLSNSVGRIDMAGNHYGTGFVVAPGLIMTNRHVLFAIAEEKLDNTWSLKSHSLVNFGDKKFEILPQVVFSGSGNVSGNVNFKNIDMAILKCKDPNNNFPPPLKFKRSESDIMKGRYAYILGYPGKPGPGYENFIILRKLFNFEFGVKRVSPGQIESTIGKLDGDIYGRVFEHDCTTLGGSSGSPIVDFDETGMGVFGLHFAGAKRIGNYAHATSVFRDELESIGLNFE